MAQKSKEIPGIGKIRLRLNREGDVPFKILTAFKVFK
jgi:hypothetical protein